MAQGELDIQKPGQIRFAFRPPSPVLIVATGGEIYVKNSRLNTVDHYDLSDTPLGLLLNENIDLKTNRSVLGVFEQNGALIVQARSALNQNRSNITLVFSLPTLELRQWIVKDNQGGNTTVALGNLQIGAQLDPAVFTVPVKDPRPSPEPQLMPVVGLVCDRRVFDGMAVHQANDEYITAVRDGSGALPLLIPSSDAPLPVAEVLAAVDGLVVHRRAVQCRALALWRSARPGTELDEMRDATTLPLLRAAIAAAKPVLAICRGFQELNVALGGTLHQHVHEIAGRLDHREPPGAPSRDAEYAPAHSVMFTPEGLLARLSGLSEAMVNSLHHQGVDRLAPDLAVEATAPDGQIEAVSMPGARGFLLGVQWHPEWGFAHESLEPRHFRGLWRGALTPGRLQHAKTFLRGFGVSRAGTACRILPGFWVLPLPMPISCSKSTRRVSSGSRPAQPRIWSRRAAKRCWASQPANCSSRRKASSSPPSPGR